MGSANNGNESTTAAADPRTAREQWVDRVNAQHHLRRRRLEAVTGVSRSEIDASSRRIDDEHGGVDLRFSCPRDHSCPVRAWVDAPVDPPAEDAPPSHAPLDVIELRELVASVEGRSGLDGLRALVVAAEARINLADLRAERDGIDRAAQTLAAIRGSDAVAVRDFCRKRILRLDAAIAELGREACR